MELSNQELANSEGRRGKPRTVIEVFKPDYITKSGPFFASRRVIWADKEGTEMGDKGKRDKAGREPKKKPQKTIKEKRKEKREKKK